MKRIRIGKDISMRWEITTDGVAIPLEGRDLTIEIKSPAGIGNNIPYRVDGNILIMTFYGYEQKRTGEYSITLWENKGKIGQNVVDVVRAFELVRTSQEENDFVGGDLQIESVDLGTENFDILTEGGYRAINIDTLQAEALEDSVNINGKTYSNESFTITLPKANLDSAGVMSADDKQTLQEHGNRIAQIKTSCEENAADIERVSNVVDTHESRLGGIDAEISSLNTEVSTLQGKVDENTTSISQINNNIADNNKSIAQINTTLDEHTESINAKITTDRIENGAVTSEKIATSAFDSTLSVSGKIAPADVVGLRIAEATNRQITPEMLSESTKQYIEASGGGTVTNLADDEDITSVNNLLKFANKDYLPASYSGLGRVYLRKNFVDGKNVLTQDMISNENTIYIIQYDFTLCENINIPANCVLKFDGGSISGAYTFTGQNTNIIAGFVKIFDTDITLAGTWNVEESYPEWFGAKADGVADDTIPFQKVINSFDTIILTLKYRITDTITISERKTIIGKNRYTTVIILDSAGNSNIVLFNVACNQLELKSFSAHSTYGGWPTSADRYGIFLKNTTQLSLKMSEVEVRSFNYGLEVLRLITSYFNDCHIVACNDGVIVRASTDVLTTTRFNNCYISKNLRNITLEKGSLLDISFIGCTMEASCYYNFLDKGQNMNIVFDNCYTEANSCGIDYNGVTVEDTENIRDTVFESITDESPYSYQHTCVLSITNSIISGSNKLSNLTKCVKLDAGVLNMQNNKFSRFSSLISLTNNYSVGSQQPKYTIIFNGSYMYSVPPALFEDETLLSNYSIVDITYTTNSGTYRRKTASSISNNFSTTFINNFVNGILPAYGYNGATKRVLIIKNNGDCVVAIDKNMSIFGKQIDHNIGSPYGDIGNYNGIGIVNETNKAINNIITSFNSHGGPNKTTGVFLISNDTTNDSGLFAIHKDSDGETDSIKVERLSAPYKHGSDGRPVLRNIYYDKGFCFFDETLGKPIWWNGTNWVDATGTSV